MSEGLAVTSCDWLTEWAESWWTNEVNPTSSLLYKIIFSPSHTRFCTQLFSPSITSSSSFCFILFCEMLWVHVQDNQMALLCNCLARSQCIMVVNGDEAWWTAVTFTFLNFFPLSFFLHYSLFLSLTLTLERMNMKWKLEQSNQQQQQVVLTPPPTLRKVSTTLAHSFYLFLSKKRDTHDKEILFFIYVYMSKGNCCHCHAGFFIVVS